MEYETTHREEEVVMISAEKLTARSDRKDVKKKEEHEMFTNVNLPDESGIILGKNKKRKVNSVAPKVIKVATYGIRNLEMLLDRRQKPTKHTSTQTDDGLCFDQFENTNLKEYMLHSFNRNDSR